MVQSCDEAVKHSSKLACKANKQGLSSQLQRPHTDLLQPAHALRIVDNVSCESFIGLSKCQQLQRLRQV